MDSPEDEDVIVDASNMNFMHVPAEAVIGTSLGFPCGEHWSWLIHVEIPNSQIHQTNTSLVWLQLHSHAHPRLKIVISI